MNLKNYESVKETSIQISEVRGQSSPSSILHSPPSLAEELLRLAILTLALLCLAANKLHACGPDFPNYILDEGDRDLLLAPVADFERELERMQLAPSRFSAVETTNDSYAQDSIEAELGDLHRALKKAKVPAEEAERIFDAHAEGREKLKTFLVEKDAFAARPRWTLNSNGESENAPGIAPPKFPEIKSVPGLPAEFADYLDGALAWHNPAVVSKATAREPWERLLARPEAERKYKSTWAAFMLGKSWMEEDPDKAIDYFQQVRTLAKKGFADSLGLAAASLGLEAKIHYEEGRAGLGHAIELYLEQFATGDSSAANSLRWSAGAALATPNDEQLREFAANPKTRRLLTAFLISHHTEYNSQLDAEARTWLGAVEATDAKDVESAEQLALAAYQAGDAELAQRWIDRAKSSPTAQWLQAKLFLRAGKVDQAAALLARISKCFPTDDAGTNAVKRLEENLFVADRRNSYERTPAGCEVLGEIGALKLARREYTQALDALLNAGFWLDAAYVAERVLTTDELKIYVDHLWPAMPNRDALVVEGNTNATELLRAELCENIRYLLGRRLARENRGVEARSYFPVERQPRLEELLGALIAGWDTRRSNDERARWLFTAAVIARTNGMALLGTETAPDWHSRAGRYEGHLTIETRTNEDFGFTRASEEEFRRAMHHHPDPDEQFHYRYQAAFLGWEAAKLMPNDSDETARVLCTSGSWLKCRDAETADLFYKSLVRRCRNTDIGEAADLRRWFPELDENGRLVEKTDLGPPGEAEWVEDQSPETMEIDSTTTNESNPAEMGNSPANESQLPPPGQPRWRYVIHRGDTLMSAIRAFARQGLEVSVQEVVDANPGLTPNLVFIGQVIFAPLQSAKVEDTN